VGADPRAVPDPPSRLEGAPEEFTCLAGTMLQETYGSSPAIRAACDASISDHAATLEADLEAVLARSKIGGVSAQSLALHTQAVLQGAFILAKAKGGPEIAKASAAHLRRYFELLFNAKDASRNGDNTGKRAQP
jgi:TetR/AcrR family transcriptional repressor of nem operon